MKRWKKVLLAVLAALALLLGGLCLWQWSNIQAVYAFLTQDSEQIAQNLEQKREEHHQAIADLVGDLTVSAPTTEQSDAILSGALTAEQVKEELGITAQLEKTGQVQEPQETQTPQEGEEEPQAPAVSVEELLRSCVAELYACKVDIMARLAELKQEALDEWFSLPAEEQTDTNLKEIGLAGLRKCYALEVEVDRQVDGILDRYRGQLEAAGGDTSVLRDLRAYYEDEKTAEKAYYMDKYLN